MAVSKQQSSLVRQRNSTGDLQQANLDASNTSVTLELGMTADKVTYVMNGSLTGTIDFSINGKDFYGSTAIPATGTPGTYNTHLVKLVRIQRTGGAGSVVVASK